MRTGPLGSFCIDRSLHAEAENRGAGSWQSQNQRELDVGSRHCPLPLLHLIIRNTLLDDFLRKNSRSFINRNQFRDHLERSEHGRALVN